MDLASNLLMLPQECCLGLGPSPAFVVILMLTVAALENPGMHRLMFPVIVMGWGDPQQHPLWSWFPIAVVHWTVWSFGRRKKK